MLRIAALATVSTAIWVCIFLLRLVIEERVPTPTHRLILMAGMGAISIGTMTIVLGGTCVRRRRQQRPLSPWPDPNPRDVAHNPHTLPWGRGAPDACPPNPAAESWTHSAHFTPQRTTNEPPMPPWRAQKSVPYAWPIESSDL